jgi:hypothetical protein
MTAAQADTAAVAEEIVAVAQAAAGNFPASNTQNYKSPAYSGAFAVLYAVRRQHLVRHSYKGKPNGIAMQKQL